LSVVRGGLRWTETLRDEMRWTGVTVYRERALVDSARDSHLRTGDCRCPDTVGESAADRSSDFSRSRLFTRFWRICLNTFPTAPYKNCTLWALSSARVFASLPGFPSVRRGDARTCRSRSRSQSRSSSRRSTEITMWPRNTRELGDHRAQTSIESRHALESATCCG
jgi:hypothetical protein